MGNIMAQESCAIILPQFIAVCVIALTQHNSLGYTPQAVSVVFFFNTSFWHELTNGEDDVLSSVHVDMIHVVNLSGLCV